MNLAYVSWKNLLNRPWSFALSLLLFALGVGLISFVVLFSHQLEKKFAANLADIDLVLGAKGSPLQLVLASMYHVDAPTGNIPLAQVQPFLNPKHPLIAQAVPLSLGDSFRGFRLVGTSPSFVDLYEGQLGDGSIWTKPMEAVLGAEVAQALGLKTGDTFRSDHGLLPVANDLTANAHHEAPFTVKGILKPTGSVLDQLIVCSTESIWKLHEQHQSDEEFSLPEKDITAVLLRYRGNSFQALNLPRNINENTNLQAASPARELNRLYELMGVGERIVVDTTTGEYVRRAE